jgi:EAL domain-containing protein (putative c-di-GMP-specific phosphodiesterase class I)
VNQIRDIWMTNVEAKYLKLEITESAVMDNAEAAMAVEAAESFGRATEYR